MNWHSDDDNNWENQWSRIVGLGEQSARKSYYPELQKKLHEIEEVRADLASANRHLQAIIDSATESSIIATDPDGIITLYNRGAEKMLGYPAEEVVGRLTPLQFHSPDEITTRSNELSAVLGKEVNGFEVFIDIARQHGSEQREWTYIRKDGSSLTVNLIVTVIRDKSDSVAGYLGIAEDITHRKAAEQALLENAEMFRLLFENSADANLLLDNDRFIACNDATVRMLGYPDKERILGSSPVDHSPERQPDGNLSVEKSNEMIAIAYELGSHRFEWLHRRMDGSDLYADVILTAIPMKGKWLLHTAWRDLTEQKKSAEENQLLTERLIASQKMESVGRLAGGIAHDFNNLLTPIIVYADMLRPLARDRDAAAKYLNGIASAAEKAKSLTRQLLAFGRKQILEMKPLDLNGTILSFAPILERTIREDVAIIYHLDAEPSCVMADRTQIEQILMNLAVNAQDAMPAGGTLSIETAITAVDSGKTANPGDIRSGDYVTLVVSDTGSGIDAETVKHIFEPFFTTKEIGKGTGLGLSTVFGIVKQHAGTVNVYSEPGTGTTFRVYLPLLKGGGESREEPQPEARIVSDRVIPATILVAEDNPMVQELLREVLQANGYNLIVAENVDEAIRIGKEMGNGIDLLLSDVIMPKKSGPALYHELVPDNPSLKVLYMSGYTENIISSHGVLAKGENFISKPFTPREILAAIDKVLREQG